MAFFDQYANRLNEAVVKHLSDGLCTYHPANGPDVPDVPYQFDSTFETFDENGMGRRVRNVLLPVAMQIGIDPEGLNQLGIGNQVAVEEIDQQRKETQGIAA